MIRHLQRNRGKGIVGCNIGKNTDTPPENAAADYLKAFRSLYQYADYFTVNISCDNSCREEFSHTRNTSCRFSDRSSTSAAARASTGRSCSRSRPT